MRRLREKTLKKIPLTAINCSDTRMLVPGFANTKTKGGKQNGNGKESSPEEKGGRQERNKEGRSEEVRLLSLKKLQAGRAAGKKCLSPFLHITFILPLKLSQPLPLY